MTAQPLPGPSALSDRAVLVVGASTGIGRAVASLAMGAGARVVVAARRRPALSELVAETGSGIAVAADVSVPGDCDRLVEEAVGAVGQLDLVVHAVGVATLAHMRDCSDAEWEEVVTVNLLGSVRLCRALLGSMAPDGLVATLSSDIVGAPRAALGPYGASKAALDQSMLSWRLEHPEIRFSTVTVGGTMPTGFGDRFDPQATIDVLGTWMRHGHMQRRQMETRDLAGALVDILGTLVAHPGVGMETIRLRSPSGPAASLDDLAL